jgi:hypothetical protein
MERSPGVDGTNPKWLNPNPKPRLAREVTQLRVQMFLGQGECGFATYS